VIGRMKIRFVPIGSNICFVRLITFMRNRFMRIESQRDRRMRIAVGIIAVISGLIGIVTAPDRVQNLSWQTYFLPVLMLALGCGYLFVAWRSRNWQSRSNGQVGLDSPAL
jgi:protein-S-isoprenylcysteine O-methyltransferase Ste14